jgi:hypothetical protein
MLFLPLNVMVSSWTAVVFIRELWVEALYISAFSLAMQMVVLVFFLLALYVITSHGIDHRT